MKTISILSCAAALGAAAMACTSHPPRELVDARAAYQRASQSPNAALAPTAQGEAREALHAAERSFDEHGDSPSTRDLAYVAERTAMSATAIANTTAANTVKELAVASLEQARDREAVATRERLERTKAELDRARAEAESERSARAAADERAENALAKIEGLTTERTDRGLKVTISGAVLFASGKSTLLPAAKKSLDGVVAALQRDRRSIDVLGHTDSSGSDATNDSLSEQRAAAVKTYLTEHGVAEERIRTEGMGESQPVASNDSPEGRANNRRVEIILEEAPAGPEAPQPLAPADKPEAPAGPEAPQPLAPADKPEAPAGPEAPQPLAPADKPEAPAGPEAPQPEAPAGQPEAPTPEPAP